MGYLVKYRKKAEPAKKFCKYVHGRPDTTWQSTEDFLRDIISDLGGDMTTYSEMNNPEVAEEYLESAKAMGYTVEGLKPSLYW